jgi:hypothetical protein
VSTNFGEPQGEGAAACFDELFVSACVKAASLEAVREVQYRAAACEQAVTLLEPLAGALKVALRKQTSALVECDICRFFLRRVGLSSRAGGDDDERESEECCSADRAHHRST